MKQCAKCLIFKELFEFSKYSKSKDGLKPRCKQCYSIEQKLYYDKNRDSILIRNTSYNKKHKERIDAYLAIYNAEHKEEKAEYDAKYSKEHKEEKATYYIINRECISTKQAAYAKANPGKFNAFNAKRHAAKLQATPKWLTDEHWAQIEAIYVEAARLTRETGIPHEVDHILPLQGKTVRGLHVPWNLQILTASENRSKKNKY